MNEEQYQSLCKACDKVLLAPDSTIVRVAIPWLHVIREHPVFLNSYMDVFEPSDGGRKVVCKWWRSLRNRAAWFRQIERSLRSDGQPWYGPEELPMGIDVLFVSHLLNPSQAGQEKDFYFGELPNQLSAHGNTVAIALINHSGQPAENLAAKWKGCSTPRMILSGSLQLLEELNLHRCLRNESLLLAKLSQKEKSGMMKRVIARASEEALSGGSLLVLRMASQIGALTAKLQPKAIVVTHEGHAWERIAFASARSAFSGVRCIGYQHAAVFRFQHAIRRNLAREYNPDHILSAGAISKAQLESAPGLSGIPISILGSNRTLNGMEVIDQHMSQANQTKNFDNPACLVLPEGIASECHLLFEFSLSCAQACPEIQFIWRLHPLMTYESLVVQNKKLRNLPQNIVLSHATLENDIARCCWALYRGTTAIVQAAVAGLRPIYLQLPGEMTIDPLYELNDWHIIVTTVPEFQSIAKNDSIMIANGSESEKQDVIKYCKDFFLPFDYKVVSNLLGDLNAR